jgi:predicted RNase H-like nuclease
VNAPLIVENTGGRRPVDEQLEHHFSGYQVKEYTVNTVNSSHPRTIGRSLIRMGFDPDPQAQGDRVIETCAQAAQVLLFGLDRVIRTKSGPMGGRKDATNRFREQIYGRLPFLDPSLEDSDALEDLMNADLGAMNGSRLGELEGKLDAVVSAYVAAFLDIRGPESSAFLGDLDTGYVLLPTPSTDSK